LNKLNCVDCVFYGRCTPQSLRECREYHLQYEDDDMMLDEYIEERRLEFRKEWFAYIASNYR